MQLPPLIEGRLLRRYKRFLADIELVGGEQITVHCPNTGAMTGCAEPGSRVWISTSDSKTRKYRHTWELVETSTGMACIHSAKANALVGEALEARAIDSLDTFSELASEVNYAEKSRVDFLLSDAQLRTYIEVKAVTLCPRPGLGLFPDAVSERARKHVQSLQTMAAQPDTRAVLLFCVLHEGVEQVSVAADIDPRYRDALASAMEAGVEVFAWGATISPQAMTLSRALPFVLDAC